VTGSGPSGTPVSPVATAGSPVASITVSVAPTAEPNRVSRRQLRRVLLKATTTAAPTGQARLARALLRSRPLAARQGRVLVRQWSRVRRPPPSSPPELDRGRFGYISSTPAAPTTSSAGAPNVTSKVLSAIVTPPPTTARFRRLLRQLRRVRRSLTHSDCLRRRLPKLPRVRRSLTHSDCLRRRLPKLPRCDGL